MSTSRPKLRLDEQSFQDMLAAAFTIQEHNAQRKKNAQPRPEHLCQQCGAPVHGDSPLCGRCAVEARPGEELQRKWASLWLMSQEQGLWPDRPAEASATRPGEPPANEPGPETVVAAHAAHIHSSQSRDGRTLPISLHAIGKEEQEEKEQIDSGIDIGEEIKREFKDEQGDAVAFDPELDWPVTTSTELRILPELDVSQLAADGKYTSQESSSEAVAIAPRNLRDLRLKDLRLTLRFHRADFYLVLAIIVATVAMVWVLSATPAPGAHRKPRLRPWERALISLGLAEAPEPPPRRGNPNISVWEDPKTALYYCAGEDLYGKAPGGHLATQGEAQMDQFEPASRAPCE
jgi:hypothetical protein